MGISVECFPPDCCCWCCGQVSTQWCIQVRVIPGLAALISRRRTATCEDTSQWQTYSQVSMYVCV